MSATATKIETSVEPSAIDQLAIATKDLEPESATTLRAAFEEMFSKAEEWATRAREIKVTGEDQKREMKLARESRLALREIRINAEKTRKRLKEDSVRKGKAIDGIANVMKALIEPIEEYLLEQETFGERAEQARKDALREAREAALVAYGVDPSVYANLGEAAEATWTSIYDGARAAHNAKIEEQRKQEAIRIEAERIAAEKAEADRQEAIRLEAERAERERLQKEENDRLKREADEREKEAKIERAAAAADRARIESQARADREAAASEARLAREQAEAERIRIEAEANAVKQAAEEEARLAREAASKAEAELAAQREAQAKAAREREEAEAARQAAEEQTRQAALLAPDREKLAAFAAQVRALDVPSLTTGKGKAVAIKVADQINKMADWITKQGLAL